MAPVLEMGGVGLRFGTGPERLAGIACAIAPGAVTTLSGEAGAGKTLLLEVAALARRPSRGSVRLFGREGTSVHPDMSSGLRRRLGWIEAEPVLMPGLDPVRDAALPLLLAGSPEREALSRAREMLAWLGAGAASGRAPSLIARQVAWARAVLGRPELVLVDEWNATPGPLRGLAQRLVAQLTRQGTAFLLTSRDEASLAAFAGRERWRMTGGRLHPAAQPDR